MITASEMGVPLGHERALGASGQRCVERGGQIHGPSPNTAPYWTGRNCGTDRGVRCGATQARI